MEETKKLRMIIIVLITIIFAITILFMGSGLKVQDTCNKVWKEYINTYCSCSKYSNDSIDIIGKLNLSFKPMPIT